MPKNLESGKTRNLTFRIENLEFEKFKKELDPNSEAEAMEEFIISRYQTVTSIRYIMILLIVPVIVDQVSKTLIFGPAVDYFWNRYQPDIFLNESQEERAFAELQRYEERVHFEILIGKLPVASYESMEETVKAKAIKLAKEYAMESADSIKNIFADITSLAAFIWLILGGQRQVYILKSFINELIYGLSDTAKAFFIILFTDMFVGFHSPPGWEVIIEALLRHFGLPESRDFIFLFISTFPVILDTIFKYWIFRYLNRVSPSAVATYHNMNE